MGKKSELIRLMRNYTKDYTNFNQSKENVKQNNDLSEEYKEKLINEATDISSSKAQSYHDKCVNLINSAIDNLREKWRKNSTGRLSDGGYQAGLSNAIKMLEMGTIRKKEDIQNIINTYADDYNALATINKVLSQSEFELQTYTTLIPEDTRDKNIELLNKLITNIDIYVSDTKIRYESSTALTCLGISGMLAFLEELDEDLQLIKSNEN